MILYFNPVYLKHPTIQSVIIDHRGSNTLSKLANLNKIDKYHTAWYSRKGINLLPFKSELVNVSGFSMPDYNPDHNMSWFEVTDQRCLDLKSTHFDRPWTVLWSGGIDSTVIVASLIKNLDRADFDNITIACTSISIWENPKFYFDYIKPNFKVVNSTDLLFTDLENQNTYFIDGFPADQLTGCVGGYIDKLYQNPGLLHTDVIKNKNCAIDYIADRTDKKFAEWYYHVLVTNADSAGVPITTFHDFVGWSGFNPAWASVKLGFLSHGSWKNLKNAKHYIDKFVNWYDSNDYQQWAMNGKNAGEKIGSGAADFKLIAKKYIYSVDNNSYYLKFKTKMASIDIYDRKLNEHWCCIDDNWNFLNLQEHKDQIISMLPDHLV